MTKFKSLKRSVQIIIIFTIIDAISIVVYVTSVLCVAGYGGFSLGKERYLLVSFTGSSATASIKPDGSISPSSATDALTSSFTMKSDISGVQFAVMDDVDIGFDGNLIDYDYEAVVGLNPKSAWGLILRDG